MYYAMARNIYRAGFEMHRANVLYLEVKVTSIGSEEYETEEIAMEM
jgi:hypothetical protein